MLFFPPSRLSLLDISVAPRPIAFQHAFRFPRAMRSIRRGFLRGSIGAIAPWLSSTAWTRTRSKPGRAAPRRVHQPPGRECESGQRVRSGRTRVLGEEEDANGHGESTRSGGQRRRLLFSSAVSWKWPSTRAACYARSLRDVGRKLLSRSVALVRARTFSIQI